jgi:pimeloyl-ACP methyl ester carboxylesterase
MGGPISLLLAERHPELVQGLVLEATAQEWHTTLTDRLTWRGLVLMEMFVRSRLARILGRRAVRRLAEGNPAIEPYVGWIQAEARRGDPADIIDAGRALSSFDARLFAARLQLPAAVVLTTGDRPCARPCNAPAAPSAPALRTGRRPLLLLGQRQGVADATRQAVDEVVSRLAGTPA